MIKETVQKSQKRIVVTGVNGFVGKHLVRELFKNQILVVGIGREKKANAEINGFLESYVAADLTQTWPKLSEIDAVIHLAGLAAVGPSFDNPQSYINLNSSMLTHMAEYYLKQAKKPRLVVISSGAIYDSDQPIPLNEHSTIAFNSPYVISKILVENQCAYYRKRGLDCIIVRPFNHIGPGQLEGFLVPDVLSQLKNNHSVTVGNITTKRDYTDVRDIARAYYLLATSHKLEHELYNASSGRSISGKEIVETLKKLSFKENTKIIVDPNKVRPTDSINIFGDASRLHKDTGWRPEFSLEQTLSDCILG